MIIPHVAALTCAAGVISLHNGVPICNPSIGRNVAPNARRAISPMYMGSYPSGDSIPSLNLRGTGVAFHSSPEINDHHDLLTLPNSMPMPNKFFRSMYEEDLLANPPISEPDYVRRLKMYKKDLEVRRSLRFKAIDYSKIEELVQNDNASKAPTPRSSQYIEKLKDLSLVRVQCFKLGGDYECMFTTMGYGIGDIVPITSIHTAKYYSNEVIEYFLEKDALDVNSYEKEASLEMMSAFFHGVQQA